MSWQNIKLGSLFKIKHGYAFKGEHFATSGKYILLTPGNFFDEGGFKYKLGKEKYYVGKFPQQYILESGDLIVAMTEQMRGLLGSSAIIPKSNLYLHNQRLGLIIELDHSQLDKKFLYYLFNTKTVRDQIQATATGAKVRHTSPANIYNIAISIPNVDTQAKIASILSAYDDLIENNTRRIQILEQMAKTIYKEWFINFRFPGHENTKFFDSPLGKIPDGWEVKKLGEIIHFIKGKKPRNVYESNVNGAVKLLLLDNIGTGNYRYTDFEERVSIKVNDIVMVMDGASSGRALIGINGFLGSTLATIKIVNGFESVFQIYYFLIDNFKNISDNNTGAAIPHANKDYINQLDFFIPTNDISIKFNKIVKELQSQILNLKSKNHNLRRTRDLLLPKLMSGEVAV